MSKPRPERWWMEPDYFVGDEKMIVKVSNGRKGANIYPDRGACEFLGGVNTRCSIEEYGVSGGKIRLRITPDPRGLHKLVEQDNHKPRLGSLREIMHQEPMFGPTEVEVLTSGSSLELMIPPRDRREPTRPGLNSPRKKRGSRSRPAPARSAATPTPAAPDRQWRKIQKRVAKLKRSLAKLEELIDSGL